MTGVPTGLRWRSRVPGRGSWAWRVAFGLILIAIVYGSLAPVSSNGGWAVPLPDWAQHALGYAMLMATLMAGQRRRRVWWSAVALILLGAALEGVQGWLGYRSAEFKDLLADAVGIGSVGVLAALLLKDQSATAPVYPGRSAGAA